MGNPFPPGGPEAVRGLPLSLCGACLRKLQWATQADLLDRYARLPPVLSEWFMEETILIWERMAQIGMPTYASFRDVKPPGESEKEKMAHSHHSNRTHSSH